jgi:hypothetical protein
MTRFVFIVPAAFVMPAQAGIQQSPASQFDCRSRGYWIIRLRG